ncbi:MAG: sigma-70 family RNA polymerase sigma factor [Pseudomonadota bacterium]
MSRTRGETSVLRPGQHVAYLGTYGAAALALPATVNTVSAEDATPAEPTRAPAHEKQGPDPDAEIARLAALGDALAFDTIVRTHGERVRAVARRMLGDPAEAEDLSQEVFVSVYSAIHSFRGEAKLSTWILRITRNHCLNRIKSWRRRRAGQDRLTHDVESLGSWPGVSAPTQGPEKNLLSREVQGQVQHAIAELPAEQRWLVVLRDIEGLDYDEIAATTGLPLGTVKSRLHRARERLATRLAPVARAQRGSSS